MVGFGLYTFCPMFVAFFVVVIGYYCLKDLVDPIADRFSLYVNYVGEYLKNCGHESL